jgi:hypothetical protein
MAVIASNGGAAWVEIQVGDAAVGSVEVRTSPLLSAAAQKDADGQDTEAKSWPGSIVAGLLQVEDAAAVGLVEITAPPS